MGIIAACNDNDVCFQIQQKVFNNFTKIVSLYTHILLIKIFSRNYMEKEMKSVVDERIVSAPINTLALGECHIDENTVLIILRLPFIKPTIIKISSVLDNIIRK